MIEYIHGDLTELTPAMAVVETAGVGYGLNISLNTYTAIQGKQEVKLYVHEVLVAGGRDDSFTLFGFASKQERELFKDEVRKVAVELGMPDFIIWRHPFPGPGLAIRIIGEVTEERLEILRRTDKIVQSELVASGWYRKVWQGFAVLLPLKTVGVMGDGRTYENVAAIRVVDSLDAMTADWSRLPSEILAVMSNRIINEVKGVNRVVFDVSSKPPATIEWE